MATERSDTDSAPSPVDDVEALKRHAKQSFITGLALLVPILVTVIVLAIAADFISDLLAPLFEVSNIVAPRGTVSQPVLQVVTLLAVVALVFVVGFFAEQTSTGASERMEAAIEAIPGVGSVYTSFREMSDILLESDTQSFRDVKLVEYPGEDSYTVAFLTAETDEVIERGTGNDDMVTLFMPMAPNPVMGGFVIHVSRDRVVDVDLTVEEGIRSIVTSGVAVGGSEGPSGLSESDLRELAEESSGQPGPIQMESTGNPTATEPTERVEEYDQDLDAEFVSTPQEIARRRQEEHDEEPQEPPEAPPATDPEPADESAESEPASDEADTEDAEGR